ncbi:ATP-binding response regulator [Allosalinactinospora lopnorensis]|uniref:ATP-binding response regulator n=1 Tax=Allosalinactinospora lopnorensis TaxID=1352348 RepID=UPI000698E737|nr:ATP-binding protein [Allosalinactinospora lopnorensis]
MLIVEDEPSLAQTVAEGLRGEGMAVDIAPELLEQLARNLTDNAIRYNHPGGEVEVTLAVLGGDSVLRVSNSGPKVVGAERLFEPFHRGSDARLHREKAGSGLGLSIARSITTAHNGTITAAPRDGGGLVVTLRLPHHSGEPAARR